STVERLHAQPVPRDRVVHHYSPLSGAAGGTAPLGAAMCSRSSFDGIPSLLAVYKAAGAEHFAGRACQILRSLHIQCGWALNRAVKAATDMPRLTPRGRDVLKLLLAGHTELVIAQKLGLSRHTVHSHCKRVYREFNVSTRGELLAHFVRRNGIGGLPASGNGRA
ncbi:MAG TPA: helix-turn-helix transcriptional regulator, partial [Tepidisphaeraceae bacterium]